MSTPVPRRTTTPSDLIYRKPDAITARNALVAIAAAWAVELVYRLLFIVEDAVWSISYGADAFDFTAEFFFVGAIVRPLFFFVPVFFAVWFLLPIVKESSLLTVMIRAAIAGVAGFVGLGLHGILSKVVESIRYPGRYGFSDFVDGWIMTPLINTVGFTVQFVLGAVLAWLWASRPRPVVEAPAPQETP